MFFDILTIRVFELFFKVTVGRPFWISIYGWSLFNHLRYIYIGFKIYSLTDLHKTVAVSFNLTNFSVSSLHCHLNYHFSKLFKILCITIRSGVGVGHSSLIMTYILDKDTVKICIINTLFLRINVTEKNFCHIWNRTHDLGTNNLGTFTWPGMTTQQATVLMT